MLSDFSLTTPVLRVPTRVRSHASQSKENKGPCCNSPGAFMRRQGGKGPGASAHSARRAASHLAPPHHTSAGAQYINKECHIFITENADIGDLMSIQNIGELCLSLDILTSVFSMKELGVPQAGYNPHCAVCCFD